MSNNSEQALNVIETHLADLNEADAFILFRELQDKFQWAGTIFTRDDIANTISERQFGEDKPALHPLVLENEVDRVANSKAWNNVMADVLTEHGWVVLDTIIHEIEQEDKQDA